MMGNPADSRIDVVHGADDRSGLPIAVLQVEGRVEEEIVDGQRHRRAHQIDDIAWAVGDSNPTTARPASDDLDQPVRRVDHHVSLERFEQAVGRSFLSAIDTSGARRKHLDDQTRRPFDVVVIVGCLIANDHDVGVVVRPPGYFKLHVRLIGATLRCPAGTSDQFGGAS
jgi:hypothetical protein